MLTNTERRAILETANWWRTCSWGHSQKGL